MSGLDIFIVFPFVMAERMSNLSKSTDMMGDLHNWELVGLTQKKTESTILCKDSSIANPETTKLSVNNKRFLKKGKQTKLKMLPLLD